MRRGCCSERWSRHPRRSRVRMPIVRSTTQECESALCAPTAEREWVTERADASVTEGRLVAAEPGRGGERCHLGSWAPSARAETSRKVGSGAVGWAGTSSDAGGRPGTARATGRVELFSTWQTVRRTRRRATSFSTVIPRKIPLTSSLTVLLQPSQSAVRLEQGCFSDVFSPFRLSPVSEARCADVRRSRNRCRDRAAPGRRCGQSSVRSLLQHHRTRRAAGRSNADADRYVRNDRTSRVGAVRPGNRRHRSVDGGIRCWSAEGHVASALAAPRHGL